MNRNTNDGEVPQHSRSVRNGSIQQSIVRALGRHSRKHESTSLFEWDSRAPIDREQVREALSVLQQIPASALTDAALDETVSRIEAAAQRNAECLATYLDHIAEHLQSIGCESEQEIAEYFDARNQMLVKLHVEASRPHPSPTRLKQLALQFALDSRRPIVGNINRFDIQCQDDVVVVRDYPSPGLMSAAIPLPGRQIREKAGVSLLNLIAQSPPPIHDLLKFIEQWLGGCPSEMQSPTQVSRVSPAALDTDLEASTVTILGTIYAVDLPVVTLVRALTSAKGLWVSSTELREFELLAGVRIDRLVKKVPKDVLKYIEIQRGKGYRLRIDDLEQQFQKLSIALPAQECDG